MEYKFKTIENLGDIVFTIITDKDTNYNVLSGFTDAYWTPAKAQEIISGIEQSQSTGKRYEWANEDVHLVALEQGVFFFDLMARRGNKNHPEGQELELSHTDFLQFLNDFKTFVEQNS